MAKVSELYISPIKSCGMIRVPEIRVTEYGIENDRIFGLVDYNGKILIQRELPRICFFEQEIRDDMVFVTAPNMPKIEIPLWEPEGKRVQLAIHKQFCFAIDMGSALADWFSEFLEHDCRLVGYSKKYPRVRRSDYLGRDINLALQDGYHALGISEASLEDFNSRVTEKLRMNRFRPNFVFSECGPYEEDGWDKTIINNVTVDGASLCVRCKTTQVDQATSETGAEPMRTLKKYRQTPDGVVFGRNFEFLNEGVIREGDLVLRRYDIG